MKKHSSFTYPPMVYYLLPMLGKSYYEYPAFITAFPETRWGALSVSDMPLTNAERDKGDEGVICLYLGVGNINYLKALNAKYPPMLEQLRASDGYITDYRDSFAPGNVTFVFEVPERWHDDFEKIADYRVQEVSKAYQREMYRMYPSMREEFDHLFATRCKVQVEEIRDKETGELIEFRVFDAETGLWLPRVKRIEWIPSDEQEDGIKLRVLVLKSVEEEQMKVIRHDAMEAEIIEEAYYHGGLRWGE